MRASTSTVLVLLCVTASLAYDYGQTYQSNSEGNTGDRRSDGLVLIDRNNQPGDNPNQVGAYEPPAYHEERIQYDERDLDPFAARNAGTSQYAATQGQYPTSSYQDQSQSSPYQTPEDRQQEAKAESEESQAATQTASQEAQTSPYQSAADIAEQQTEQAQADQSTSTQQPTDQSASSPQNTPADPYTSQAASLPEQSNVPQADQTASSPYQSQDYAQSATEQAASLNTPVTTQQAPAADQQAPATAEPVPAADQQSAPAGPPASGAAQVPSADSAAYTQTPQLLNDDQTVNTIPNEDKGTPAAVQAEQKDKENDADTKTAEQPKLEFHLNRAGYSQMTMLNSDPGLRVMPPALQQTVFKQLGVIPSTQQQQQQQPSSEQASDQTTETPQTTAQEEHPESKPAESTSNGESTAVKEIQSDVKPADKEQTKEKSKSDVLNFTIRVKPEHKNQPELQDIAFFPSQNANGKPLLVLKQNVTRPIVENIEITLPKGHSGKPIIKVFRDGTPEAKALERGMPANQPNSQQQVPQQQVQQQQQQQQAPRQQDQQQVPQQQIPQQQDLQQQQIPQQQDQQQQQQIPQQQDQQQQQQIPQQQYQQQQAPQQQDQQQEGDKQEDQKPNEGDEPKKYYDTEGNEIPPPPYDDYPGTMEDLKQSFKEVDIPYPDNPACVSYTPQHCGNVWTQRNCPHLCKLKVFAESKKPVVLGELPCFDYPECPRYPTTYCDPKFGHFWVRNHCRKMCGICKKSSLLCYDRAKCKIFQISDCANKFVKYTCPKKCSSCAAGLALWKTEYVHGFPYKKSSISHHHKSSKHNKRHSHKKRHLKRSRREETSDNGEACKDKPECPTFPSKICNHQWMIRNCPEMCGVCAEKAKQKKIDAENYVDPCAVTDHSDCARYTKDRCQDSWLTDNCKHMCGKCSQAVESVPQQPAVAQYVSTPSQAYRPQGLYGKRSAEEDEELEF